MKHSESSLGNVCSQIWWCKFIVKLHRDSNNSITLHFLLLTLSDNRAIPSSIVGTKPDSACNCRRRTHTLIEHQTGQFPYFHTNFSYRGCRSRCKLPISFIFTVQMYIYTSSWPALLLLFCVTLDMPNKTKRGLFLPHSKWILSHMLVYCLRHL